MRVKSAVELFRKVLYYYLLVINKLIKYVFFKKKMYIDVYN